jgi:hypothetical protein
MLSSNYTVFVMLTRMRFLFLLVLLVPLQAKVVRTEIISRNDVLQGRQFGKAGTYERIVGRVYFSLKVGDSHNNRIVDLDKAETIKNGEVEFFSDFVAIRPKDAARGNGSTLLEIPNRGSSRILSILDGGDWDLQSDPGDGWLLRNGYGFVALGWQWDATGDDALRLYAPIAKDHGKTIQGLLRGDLMPSRPMAEIPLGHLITGHIGGTEYPVSTPDDSRNTLSIRDSREAKRSVIPRSDWRFAQMTNGKWIPSNRFIWLKGGFQPGRIYEYVYVVENPVIAGLGFAAVRDFASYMKHSPDALIPASRVYAEGISQNGRFLRDFLYQGFNADEQNRMALDGVLAHVAGAGRGSFNYRFAQPSRDAQPTSSVFFPTDIFPFTDLPETDPLTGETQGLLDRVMADRVVPKIFLSNTSYEYWGRVASLIHSSADGKHDVSLSPNVRVYHFTGLQHFSVPSPPQKGSGDLDGQEPQSPLPVQYFWRAMIANMDAWVRSNRLPPEGAYPKVADGNLVPLGEYHFPALPGLATPREASQAYRLDFGPEWTRGILNRQPPKVGAAFPVLLPQVDADGNERDGVRLPEIVVPLATYTGWNLRDPSIGAPDQRVPFEGSYLPFPRNAAERKQNGDPRKSVLERYHDREDYLARYSKAIDTLAQQHYILAEDKDALLRRGQNEWDETMPEGRAHASR